MANDVMVGANTLAADRAQLAAHELEPMSIASWEWRWLVDGEWKRLPHYAASVFEGALRNGCKHSSVHCWNDAEWEWFLVADLENFRVALGGKASIQCSHDVNEYDELGPWFRLTRFRGGHPSATPDLRSPGDLERKTEADIDEVVEVDGVDALNARTLAGKLVFSIPKEGASTIPAMDLVERISVKVGVPPEQLQLAAGERSVDPEGSLLPFLKDQGDVELLVLVCDKAPNPVQSLKD